MAKSLAKMSRKEIGKEIDKLWHDRAISKAVRFMASIQVGDEVMYPIALDQYSLGSAMSRNEARIQVKGVYGEALEFFPDELYVVRGS